MLGIFQEEKIITICMFVFLGLSIFTRVLLGYLYQSMIRETDNMAATENKLLKQCKMKFTNCYQLNQGVANIPVFVDKFLNRLALGPFSFITMYHISGQTMLLSVVSAGIGICKSIMDGRMLGEILPFYIVSFFGLYVYFSISTVVDIKGKKRVLKVNLVDYLENHLSARIDVTAQDMEMLYGKRYSRSRNARLSSDYGKRTIELVPINRKIAVAGMEADSHNGVRQDDGVEEWATTAKGNVAEEWGMPDKGACTTGQKQQNKEDLRVTEEEIETLLQELLMV